MKLTTDNATAPVFFTMQDPAAGDGEAGGAAGGTEGGGEGGQGGTIMDGGGNDGGEGGQQFTVPEKFIVNGQDGALDHQKTLQKVLGSYGELEQRAGTLGLPPKTADEYQLEAYMPDGYEAVPEREKATLAEMHKLGLTNKQVQGVLKMYGAHIGEAVQHQAQTLQTLRDEWGDQTEARIGRNKEVVRLANIPELNDAMKVPAIGNHVGIIKLLDFVANELGEDRLPNTAETVSADDFETLRRSDAYLDAKHPDHKATVAKVNAFYRAQSRQG